MARRGFFAELNHQSQLSARRAAAAHQAGVREYNAAVRRAEQARKAAERAQAQLAKATETERKRLEKEARESHIEEMEAEADERNSRLTKINSDIDSILQATLGLDNFIDLKTLVTVVKHPPFQRPDLEAPLPPPTPSPLPKPPMYIAPAEPTGLASLFGKKRYTESVAKAQEAHEAAFAKWQASCEQLRRRHDSELATHAKAETKRIADLATERARYAQECVGREAEAAERNRHLEELTSNLGYGTVDAVQEYVSIVLSNSIYPEHFAVTHEFTFDPSSAELKLRALMPGPDEVPKVKSYKYNKGADEIVATAQSQKVCRDRYESAMNQVALRSIHEIFEADRRGLIKTISLEVGTNSVDPATGRWTYIPLVVVGAERESFLEFDLSAVVPELTLGRLGAAVSMNPYLLVTVDSAGVRRT